MRKHLAFLLLVGACVLPSYAIDFGPTSFALHLGPGMQVPLGTSADYFTIGGLVSLTGEFAFTEDPRLFASAGIEYLLGPLVSGQSMSALAGDIGAGVYLDITSRLSLKASAAVGYNYSFLNGTGGYTGSGVTSGGSLHVAAGLGVGYLLLPSLSLGLGVGYDTCLGLTNGITVALGTSYYLTGTEARRVRIEQGPEARPENLRAARTPNPDDGIQVKDV